MTDNTIEILSPRGEQENRDIGIRILTNDLVFAVVKRNPHISEVVRACLEASFEMAVTGDWLVIGKTVKASQEIVLRTMNILSECLLTDRSEEDYTLPRSSVKPYLVTGVGPVAIKFSMFPDKVADGTKRHAIRDRKMVSPGDLLELRRFQPTDSTHLLLAVGICTHVELIDLDPQLRFVKINGQHLTTDEIESLALADGFDDSEAFWDFFKYPLENRFLIHWEPLIDA